MRIERWRVWVGNADCMREMTTDEVASSLRRASRHYLYCGTPDEPIPSLPLPLPPLPPFLFLPPAPPNPLSLSRSPAQVLLENGQPLKRINELEMVKGYVFANVWFDEHLYKIDPATGGVVDSYNFSELYPKVRFVREFVFPRPWRVYYLCVCCSLRLSPHSKMTRGRACFGIACCLSF